MGNFVILASSVWPGLVKVGGCTWELTFHITLLRWWSKLACRQVVVVVGYDRVRANEGEQHSGGGLLKHYRNLWAILSSCCRVEWIRLVLLGGCCLTRAVMWGAGVLMGRVGFHSQAPTLLYQWDRPVHLCSDCPERFPRGLKAQLMILGEQFCICKAAWARENY